MNYTENALVIAIYILESELRAKISWNKTLTIDQPF